MHIKIINNVFLKRSQNAYELPVGKKSFRFRNYILVTSRSSRDRTRRQHRDPPNMDGEPLLRKYLLDKNDYIIIFHALIQSKSCHVISYNHVFREIKYRG